MNIKSLKTQFFGAIAMVLVAAIAMGSSTYAWFSMNTKVTVTGMQVKTSVTENLLIARDTLGSTAKQNDNLFENSLNQEVKGVLEPVSTTDGVNYWYTATSNVKASGDAINESYLNYADGKAALTSGQEGYGTYEDAFSRNYGVSTTIAGDLVSGETMAKGYVDYVFQLKAVDPSGSSEIRLTNLDLKYNNGALGSEKAYRVAVFAADITNATAAGISGVAAATNLKKIYALDGARNFTQVSGVDQAVVSTSGFDSVSDNDLVIASINTSGTSYHKVVVRLWLEGEDTTCNNQTFMPLTNNWTLELEIRLVGALNTDPECVAVSHINEPNPTP